MKSQLSHYVNKMSKVCLLAFASLLFTLPTAAQANDNAAATLAIKLDKRSGQNTAALA